MQQQVAGERSRLVDVLTPGRRTAVVAAIALLAAAVGAAAYGFGGRADPAGAEPALNTVEVVRMSLVDYVDASGQVGYGPVTTLRYTPPPKTQPPDTQEEPGDDDASAGRGAPPGGAQTPPVDEGLGLITWLPPVGSVVERGDPLLRVDDRPVALLLGALPLYRTLTAGVRGADVRQFEENLRALGGTGFTVDEYFSAATAAAVRRWQKGLGRPQTGSVTPGEVVYALAAVRVADHRLRVGDAAAGDVLGVTGAARTVSAAIDRTRLQHEVTVGSAVTIVFPDGSETPATVRRVGPAPVDPQGPPMSDTAIVVEAEADDQAALADREGTAILRFVAEERRDVLVVPVIALVALAEGGYGLQIVEGSTTRYAVVETGLFARGFVEVTGDVRPGQQVLVPS
jgi:peptidoglycan hydrolase-like protein with peptidoglycan-binding domain